MTDDPPPASGFSSAIDLRARDSLPPVTRIGAIRHLPAAAFCTRTSFPINHKVFDTSHLLSPLNMPGLVSQPLDIALTTTKPLPLAVSTSELLDIADKHITKGLGRLRNHVFKEGRGLRVLTSVRFYIIPTVSQLNVNRDDRTTSNCWTSPLVSVSPRLATVTPTSQRLSSPKPNPSSMSNAVSHSPNLMLSSSSRCWL